MEVGVKVLVENYISGSRRKSRQLTNVVAVDRHGRKLEVAPASPRRTTSSGVRGALRRREASRNERERRKAARA